MKKIKLLQVFPRHPHGGIYRVNMDLLEAFHNDDHFELHIALVESKNYRGEFNFGNLSPQYTEIEGGLLERWRQLRKLAKRHDLIHLHGFTPWDCSVFLTLGAKIVFTNHGLLGVGRKLKPHEHLKRYLMKLFLRHRADHIFNISHYARDRVVNEYNVSKEKTSVVHNCTRWESSKTNFSPNGKLTIGFHGRFVAFKRVDRLLKVAALAAQKLPVKVQLLGDGPLKTDYAKQARQLGLDIDFIGYTLAPRAVIENYDVEIVSSDEEYFGLVVLESILAGNPTFVFEDGGGCTEILNHEESKWFICRDEQEMASKICYMYENKADRAILNRLQALQHHVSANFSLQNFKERYKAGYLKTVD